MFTEQDTACIRAHGLTPEAVERQLENFCYRLASAN